jgi:hypothetical protein
MEMFVYVNFSRDMTLHSTIRDVNQEGVERLENEVRGNDNEEILYIIRASRGKKYKRHRKKEQRVSRCKVGEKKKTENARQDTSKRKHKRDGKNEHRVSSTLRWEEKKNRTRNQTSHSRRRGQ